MSGEISPICGKLSDRLFVSGSRQVKILPIAAVLIFLFGLMAYTNPNLQNYEGFVNRLILQETQKQKNPLVNAVGALFGDFAGGLIVDHTRRDDYIFFSVYDSALGKEHIKAIGLLNNFILTEKPELLGNT